MLLAVFADQVEQDGIGPGVPAGVELIELPIVDGARGRGLDHGHAQLVRLKKPGVSLFASIFVKSRLKSLHTRNSSRPTVSVWSTSADTASYTLCRGLVYGSPGVPLGKP